MLNRCIKYFIEHKFVALLLLLLFAGWGISHAPFNWGIEFLPKNPVAVDAIPDLGENQQIVFTKWEGHTPQDIEDQITYPLTSALLGIPGVKTIRSSSMFGFSSIYIIFEESIDFYWSRSRILEKLNALPHKLLPQGVTPSLGPDATGLGQIFWYTLEGRDTDGNTTGGWDLQELRTLQDYYVKNALSSASGVSEVASIGGYLQEYQIDVNPELMRQYNIRLNQLVKAVKESNREIGAQTIEINKVEYLVRGLGYIKSITELENTVVSSQQFKSITIKDIAKVTLGPAPRRGVLDKEGAEVVGAVVVARYGANPLSVINQVKAKIDEISPGLPSKILKDGRRSQVTLVPFYDRTELIQDTLGTLHDALALEILITILVIIVMLRNIKASVLISGLLPLAVLMVFIAMKYFGVDANIVALSGIVIAIGTMVDVGVILAENIVRHLNNSLALNTKPLVVNTIVYKATVEVSGAILTAVTTTIISFIPVFTMIGAEGKLFRPLAFTKTFALIAALIVALFLIPPLAAFLFKRRRRIPRLDYVRPSLLILIGVTLVIYGFYLGLALVLVGVIYIYKRKGILFLGKLPHAEKIIAVVTIIVILAQHWRPLGLEGSLLLNVIVVGVLCFGFLFTFWLFQKKYLSILNWTLHHRVLFLTVPITLVLCGFLIMKNTGKEFMPSLNEGSFLLMPTSMPHSGIEENKRVLQLLDRAVANIPEVETVVGKAGRVESALDPAPLSMYENIIHYKSEYLLNNKKEPQRFKTNKDGYFILKDGSLVGNPNNLESTLTINPHIRSSDLLEDNDGEYYRNWRPEIKSPNDIWNEIVKVTQLLGVTSAPKLQPIETRLIMLQTGIRSPMGIKIKGQDLEQIEAFGLQLQELLKQVEGVKAETVFADRIIGKPYMLIDIDRTKIARYGVSINEVQKVLEVAIGGLELTKTIEGRERYSVRVRYPRALRTSPSSIKQIYIPLPNSKQLPLSELASIKYEQGPQVIKSEDTFLVGYVLFDKKDGYPEITIVEKAQAFIHNKIASGALSVPNGISFQFTGTYENQLRAEKTLAVIVPLALLLILIILYFQFQSISTSLMIFTGVTVAFSGGFIMLWLYGQDWFLNITLFGENLRELFNMKTINLSVAVWVGFIALFGISTDDGVIMATYLKQTFNRKTLNHKKAIHEATLEAAGKRIRPCLMTTVTTVLALFPVLSSTGRGSDIMIPMAVPIMGGMLIDITSYFIVPVLYSWREELKLKKSRAHEKF